MDRSVTESLCPACLDRIPARRLQEGDAVYLEKSCPLHGSFRTRLWKGLPDFRDWNLNKIPTQPAVVYHPIERGCPFDCGLCPDHRQRSCTILLEVTRRCDLGCAVCFADSRTTGEDPSREDISRWYQRASAAGGNCNIQLSGGEPTLRDDLPEIVSEGKEQGFGFVQLNTNGLRLARDRAYLKALKQAGLSSIFLQFDGTEDAIFRKLRGRSLLKEKQEAIAACGEEGIGVVLVPTVVPEVNGNNVGAILKLALEYSPVVRGVHFQPVSYFGRFPAQPTDPQRITLPELMGAIETQTEGLFKTSDYRPPGCENALCSFHGHYLVNADGTVQSLQREFEPSMVLPCIRADEGADRAISYLARQWSAKPLRGENRSDSVPATAADQPVNCCSPSGLMTLEAFMDRARNYLFSISAMAFQDVWNITLDRVRDCCIHVMSPEGNLVPFCLYNLTSMGGRPLYRP
jgi:7,8-dihydro-6-hydroxymethylpterin dimethyltransferase